jgi:hypothetical protein
MKQNSSYTFIINQPVMKYMLHFLFITTLIIQFNTLKAQTMKPEELAQGQLDAYNIQDIEGFLSFYSADVEVYNFPNDLVYKGIDKMRERYTKAWTQNPNQKATVTDRISVGYTVMDKEHVTGRASGIEAHVIAIYKIENGKIRQVYFVRE